MENNCPCGTGRSYAECCEPLHAGVATATTAEQLMRSRYCAYALRQLDYLHATHHPDKRAASAEDLREWAEAVNFTGLEVLSTSQGGSDDKIGKVAFKAHYREVGEGGRVGVLQETSRFRRWQGRWVYYDGSLK